MKTKTKNIIKWILIIIGILLVLELLNVIDLSEMLSIVHTYQGPTPSAGGSFGGGLA